MSHRRVSATLFASLFAAQAAFLVLGSVLPRIAASFGITTAEAGTLRTFAGVAGAAVAGMLATGVLRVSVDRLLTAGLVTVGGSAIVSACAPSFAVLSAAQAGAGAGMTLVLAAGVAAASRWAPLEHRARTLAWALV